MQSNQQAAIFLLIIALISWIPQENYDTIVAIVREVWGFILTAALIVVFWLTSRDDRSQMKMMISRKSLRKKIESDPDVENDAGNSAKHLIG